MKKIALILLASLPAMVFAQDGKYIIEGNLAATYNAPAKVYLQYRLKDKSVTDSTAVKGGKFQFAGTAGATPLYAYISLNKKGSGPHSRDNKRFFLEQGTITVTSTDSIGNSIIAGTKTNETSNRYDIISKPVNDAYDALEAKKSAATPEQQQSASFEQENNKTEKALELQESISDKKFIQDNPDSYFCLEVLENFAYSADYVDIEPLFNGLSVSVKATEDGKKFAERLPVLKAVALGATAPEFIEADTSGKMVSLSSFRGKYVLIDFWASWCGPCRHENPNVVKAYNHYKNQNFTIVGVSLDRPGAKDKWLNAIHKDGLTWTQLSDLKFWNSKTAALYGVHGIPQNFLLDPDGKIIAKNLRGNDLEDKLQGVFEKISSGK